MDILRTFFNEIKIMYRSKSMIFLTVVVPIILMIILGYIFPSMLNPANYRIAVYNEDTGEYSKVILSLVYGMLKGDSFVSVSNYDDLTKGLNDGTFDGAIIIPKGFSEDVQHSNNFSLNFVPSVANIQTSVVIYQALRSILSEVSNGVMIYNILELYKKPSVKIPIGPPKLSFEGPAGSNLNYIDFMIPGIAAFIAIASIAISLSSTISYEREHGILSGIIVSTVNRTSYIFGKTLAYTFDGIVKGSIALLTAQIYFGSGFNTPLRSILILALGSFAFSAFGMIVAVLSPNQKISGAIIIGYVVPTIFVSGLFIPIDQMPQIARMISKFFPLTFMADAMQRVSILNFQISQVMMDIVPLLIYAIVAFLISTLAFHRIEKLEEI
ncbi:MAG: ABC transporter permease [Athalassotoga sp.]|uniref:ABC transporter permease n=1 Tax=Athalassotoga sp. TaxID=2022597 RepID=UPI003CFCAA0F